MEDKSISKVIETNSQGVQLVAYPSHYAIRKPVKDDVVANICYHTGKEKYIKRIWKEKFRGK